MKLRREHLFKMAALTAVLTLNVSLFESVGKKASEVNAYSASSLPTTINLNDCTEQEIRFYYSDLNSLSASQRKGTNLLKNLKPILMNNQKYCNYDSGDNVWKIYEISDRDWEKSPASSTTYGIYNANTNTITNYQYGSNGSVKNNPFIHALYINRDIDNQTRAWGNHNQDDWGINREHIWAKSHGFDSEGAGGARGDPMHLWAANGWANHEHSNYFFAFVDTTRTYSDAGSKYNTVYNNLTGYSKNAGGNQTVFEPQDCDKGDIARSVFYMVARYNNYANEASGFDSDNPNLILLNDLSENTRTGTSSADTPYGMGLLRDLLAWNKLDPVDEYEIHRNNLLYRNYTNNRNPFIDFPNWADAIWGTADLDGTNYNSTINTVANPASDPIGSTPVSTLAISETELEIEVGETAEIYAENANGQINWSVDDDTIVSLDRTSTSNYGEVTITALSAGTTTITAENGGNSVTCEVTVTNYDAIYGTEANPLTITQAKALIESNGGALTSRKMYVRGTISSNSAYNTQYNNYDNVWLQSEDGQTANAFDLYRCKLDSSITDDYSLANSMQGLQVVAYGYGKKYNTTYELSPNNNNAENPLILSLESVVPPEPTAQELIEEQTTSTKLSYRYTKETTEGGATDSLTHSFIGVSGSTYADWLGKTDNSGVVYAGQSAGGDNTSGDAVQLRSKNSNSGIIVTGNETGYSASSISLVWNTASASGRRIDVYGKNTAYSSPTDLYGDNKGTLIGSLSYDGSNTETSFDIDGSYAFIGLKSNSGALYLEEIQIQWGVGSVTTYEYRDVSIRFGGLLSQDLWNDLDTENHVIEGFGVMITTDDVIGAYEIKDLHESAILAEEDPDIEEDIVDYYMAESEMNTPPEQGDNYYWNLFHRITDLKQVYVAAAYIKTSTEYVFFRQVRYSAKTLAGDYIANRGYASNSANGSLSNLANLA